MELLTAGPLLSASLETVAHCRNVASLSFFVIILEKRKISELAELVSDPYI